MNPIAQDILMHYGTPRHSGRYPWGSGEDPYQHDSSDFAGRVQVMRKNGFTYTDKNGKTYQGDVAIAKSMGISTGSLRTQYSLSISQRRAQAVSTAKALREKGYSLTKIGQEMGGLNESSVRSLLNTGSETRMLASQKTADFLKEQVDSKGIIDIGKGTGAQLGISQEKLNQAVYILQAQGYTVKKRRLEQATNPGKFTTLQLLCPPGTQNKDVYKTEQIHRIGQEYKTENDGETYHPKFEYPASLDSKRLQVRYAEEGGLAKDGLVQLRRGVQDISLGNDHYSQVRIMVDNQHYIKGMAVYADDLPPGVDVRFNTNKTIGTPLAKVLKPLKTTKDGAIDIQNPFGSLIKQDGGQRHYVDADGNEKLSLINKRAAQGDWGEWADTLSSQFLSKQTRQLAQKQLKIAQNDRVTEFQQISSLNNPTVKKALLQDFANSCDSAAVHLKAAALPRQKYQVILPLTTIGDNEVYAPQYKDGQTVALIRYPHGGTFQIPILKVNNKNSQGTKMISPLAKDAVGINSKVAGRLSGADFDGDTVMVIPCNEAGKPKIISTPALKQLQGFDPKMQYPQHTGMKYMKYVNANGKQVNNTQIQMGKISNLITDMTLKGAPTQDIAKAVRHSMVVIDAGKHKLDYTQSYIDNDIATLKKQYQGHYDEYGNLKTGAGTLISRSSGQKSVPKRIGSPKIDPDTGQLVWKVDPDRFYTNYKNGKVKERLQKSTQMGQAKDANELSSGHPMQTVYANYANKMKSLANQARLQILHTGHIPYNAVAKQTYANQVASLNAKLNIAQKNKPLQRAAQRRVQAQYKRAIQMDPNLQSNKAEQKKFKQKAIVRARSAVGASGKGTRIQITDKEWAAIQAGAITQTKLKSIISNCDKTTLRDRATPHSATQLSSAKVSRLKAYSSNGYTVSQIASALGISTSTVNKYLNESA